MTTTIDAPALTASGPQEQPQPEQQERVRVSCRRCAEVQHGGPSCN
ncbi:hypothetical protein [Arthrobacter sp. NPDC092385]